MFWLAGCCGAVCPWPVVGWFDGEVCPPCPPLGLWPVVEAPPAPPWPILLDNPNAETVRASMFPLAWTPCCRWNVISASRVCESRTPVASPLSRPRSIRTCCTSRISVWLRLLKLDPRLAPPRDSTFEPLWDPTLEPPWEKRARG